MNSGRVVKGLLGAAVITPGLALGAVHAPVLAVYLVIAAVIFFYLSLRPHRISRARFDLASALMIGLILFTAFQLLPLPAPIVELISPNAHEVRARALEPLGIGAPTWMPLTLDATLTAVEVGKLVFYLAVYWLALSWTRRHGSSQVLMIVALAGVAGAAVLLGHKILMLDRIYDFYVPLHKPIYGTERISAPLVNENHMGGFLGLAAAAAIGQALAASSRSRRVLMIGVAALIGGSLLLTLSRGAISAFIAGQMLFIFIRIIQRIAGREGNEPRRNLAWLPLGLALSLGLGLFVAQDAIIGEYADGSYHKLEMIQEALPVIGKFPSVGAGRGAFWVAFPLVSDWGANTTFTHAENVIPQLLVDWGVVVGGIALVGFAYIIARRLVRPRSRVRPIAALAGLVAFGLHNLLDFNLEIPGVAVLAVALLGALVGSETTEQSRSKRGERRRARMVPRPLLLAGSAAALALALVAVLYVAPHSLDNDERKLRVALTDNNRTAFAAVSLERLLLRHPASWYIPFLAGVHSYHAQTGNPLTWLSRATEINPSSASTHLYIGRSMLRLGKLDQAMLELRLAVRGNAALAPPTARFLITAAPSFDRLSRIALDRADKLLLWGALAREFSVRGLETEAEAADLAVLSIDPKHPQSLARHGRRLIKRGEFEEALGLAVRLGALPEFGPAAAILEAQVHHKLGATDKQLIALRQGLKLAPRHPGLLRALAWAEQRAGNREQALAAAAELRSTATDQTSRSAAAVLEGDLERDSGRIDAAIARYRQAFAMNPSNPSLLERIVKLAERQGDNLHAFDALRRLVELDPTNAEWRRRLQELEKKGRMKPIEIP